MVEIDRFKNKEIINKLIMINNGNKNIETKNEIQEKRKGQRALMKKNNKKKFKQRKNKYYI